MAVTASSVSAFLADFPGTQRPGGPPSLADSGGVCPGRDSAGRAHFYPRTAATDRGAALEPRPVADVVSRHLLRVVGSGAVAQLSSRRVGDSASANEVGDARYHSRRRALHSVLCGSLPGGESPQSGDEGLGIVAGLSAAHLRLRHLPLPLDGRGPHLQARHGLHHRRGRDYGGVFRGCGHCFGALSSEIPQRRSNRIDRSHRRDRVAVRSVQKPVSYTHLRAHETVLDLVCRLLLEKKKKNKTKYKS